MKSKNIKSRGSLVALFAAALMWVAPSCTADDASTNNELSSEVALSTSALEFGALDTEAQSFTIATEGVWEITPDATEAFDWINFSQESGKGEAKIEVTVEPNRAKMRSSVVSVVAGGQPAQITISQAAGVPVKTVFETPYMEGTLMERKGASQIVYIVLPYVDGDGSTYEDITTTTSGIEGVTVETITATVEADGYPGQMKMKVSGVPAASGELTFSIAVPGYDAIEFSVVVEEFVEPTFFDAYTSSPIYFGSQLDPEVYLVVPYENGLDGVVNGVTVEISGAGSEGISANPAATITLAGAKGEAKIPLAGQPTLGKGEVTFTIKGLASSDIVYTTAVQNTRQLFNGKAIPNRTNKGTIEDTFAVPYTLGKDGNFGELSSIIIDAPNTDADITASGLKDIRRNNWWSADDPADKSKWGYWEITLPNVECVSGGYLCFGHTGGSGFSWDKTNTKALCHEGAAPVWKITYCNPKGEWVDSGTTFSWPCGANNNYMFVRDYALICDNKGNDANKCAPTDPIMFPIFDEFKNQDIKIRFEMVDVGTDPSKMVFIAFSLNVWYVLPDAAETELLPANFSTEFPM